MPSKSLFIEPFDEGTLFKLKILNDYLKEWLPVFIAINNPRWNKIQIFDLFAGMGKDSNGVSGSPRIILEEVNKWKSSIQSNNLNVRIILNEYEKKYFEALLSNVEDLKDTNGYELKEFNKEFKVVFDEYYESMKSSVNFLFLDQNGIKQITENVFKEIIKLKQTDFLFFISSSFIKRFGESENFQKHLKITKQDLNNKSYYHIHRIVVEYYRSLIPKPNKYFLAPFSIKKPAGIYGLIFGTNHIYGLEKFLNVCWKHDKLTGEANFDIDSEKIDLLKPFLFEQLNVPKKMQLFEQNLKNKILSRILKTDVDVYIFSLEEGFLPKHANKILNELYEENKIKFDFKPVNNKVHKIKIPSLITII
ncbi:MAG: three-Cys-motif partner protein TcmP [Chitinophagaceae bacterium]